MCAVSKRSHCNDTYRLIHTDYVMHLRQHLKHGPPPSEAEQHHHMDLVNYWRDQYLLEREECERLRNTNVKLERSNQQLSNHSSVTLEERPSTPLSSSNLHPASPLRSPRRRKSPSKAAPLDPNAQTQGTIESDFDLYEGLGLGTSVVKHFSRCRH